MEHDVIGDLERELNQATSRAWSLVNSTDGRLFTVRPNSRSWSAAECLSHLSISSETFIPILKGAIDKASTRKRSKRRPRMDPVGRVLRWFLEPPIRRKMTAQAPFVPRSVRAKAEAFGEFAALQSKLSELLSACHDLNLGRVKVVSPFRPHVKYNLYSAFRILIAHQRRHLWQAEQAIAALKH